MTNELAGTCGILIRVPFFIYRLWISIETHGRDVGLGASALQSGALARRIGGIGKGPRALDRPTHVATSASEHFQLLLIILATSRRALFGTV